MFPLKDFEAQIPGSILTRGRDYFEQGAVVELEEHEQDHWQATVAGTDDYEVEIMMKDAQVLSWSCTCPYDGGSICKHVVATLYALRKTAPVKTAKTRKTASAKMDFEAMLLAPSLDELRAFIRHQKKQDRKFEQQFMLYFADKDPKMDVEKKYRSMVRQLVRSHSDRGFMHYSGTYAFTKAMLPVVQAAQIAAGKNNFRDAFAIAKVICLEGMEVIQQGDDSAGNIGDLISEGIRIISEIVQSRAAAPEVLIQVFDWLETNLKNEAWFEFGDYASALLDIAQATAKWVGPERFIQLLDSLAPRSTDSAYTSEFRLQMVIERKILFFQEIGRSEEAGKLISEHLHLVDIREIALDNAIENRDFALAKKLIADGIIIAESKKHSGTVWKWETRLLHIAELENDVPAYRTLAMRFALSRGFNREYYRKWKASYTAAEWLNIIEQHIQSVIIEEKAKFKTTSFVALDWVLYRRLSPIYVEEQRWEALFQLIPEDPGIDTLNQVRPYLSKLYPGELLAHYLPALEKKAEQASSRPHYQEIVRLMQEIKQSLDGSGEAIDALAEALIKQYPRRPAMVEELNLMLAGEKKKRG